MQRHPIDGAKGYVPEIVILLETVYHEYSALNGKWQLVIKSAAIVADPKRLPARSD